MSNYLSLRYVLILIVAATVANLYHFLPRAVSLLVLALVLVLVLMLVLVLILVLALVLALVAVLVLALVVIVWCVRALEKMEQR